jgi:hypothetical protein
MNGNNSDEDERMIECRANIEVGDGLGRRHVENNRNERREIDIKYVVSNIILIPHFVLRLFFYPPLLHITPPGVAN